jgi:hypothetical protein
VAATLAQIIGVEQAVRSSTEQWWKLVAASLRREELLTGLEKTYEPAPGRLSQPDKSQRVQLNVEGLLAEARQRLGRYFDVTATKDWANAGGTGARADVSVNGTVILHDAPATFLLFLDKRLAELLADIRKIPVQSAAEDWLPSTKPGEWRTAQDKSQSTTKDVEFRVVSPAEGMRPAQYEPVPHDVVTGEWTTVKFTSAPTAARSQELQWRISVLREAVQLAIHDANRAMAPDQRVSGAIFDYIFDGTTGA